MIRSLAAGVALSALMGATPVVAADLILGAYAHDVTWIGEMIGSGAAGRESGADIELGVRSRRLETWTWLLKPQAHAFISVNTRGTSNFVAAGLSWPIPIGERLYLRPGLGLAYTDGKAGLPPANAQNISPAETARRLHLYYTRIDFGSKILFQPELGLGYRFSPRLAGELSWVHISNGEIFHQGKNQGLDDAGVRLIYSFGPGGR
ncbi:MAG TPA: acyloxyacyl hydrolase [Phenylobacterium sp.]|nr:acyloxyacyl hydrolase [Phenylobacterium sp.]